MQGEGNTQKKCSLLGRNGGGKLQEKELLFCYSSFKSFWCSLPSVSEFDPTPSPVIFHPEYIVTCFVPVITWNLPISFYWSICPLTSLPSVKIALLTFQIGKDPTSLTTFSSEKEKRKVTLTFCQWECKLLQSLWRAYWQQEHFLYMYIFTQQCTSSIWSSSYSSQEYEKIYASSYELQYFAVARLETSRGLVE